MKVIRNEDTVKIWNKIDGSFYTREEFNFMKKLQKKRWVKKNHARNERRDSGRR